MTSSLLLKGLAGVAALGGTVGGLAVYRKEIFGWGKGPEEPKSEDVSGFSHKELIDKVGLSCGLEGNDLTDNTPKDCTVKEGGSINIKKREQEEEGVTFTTNGSTKLKVSKSEEKGADGTDKYNKKLKFVVDSGDLTLTKKEGGSNATTIPKLEQFETYEIFLKKDGKFYLSRKTDAKEEKIKALGLPSSCTLPESGDSNCSLTTQEEIKKVKFENQDGGVTVTGTVTLKVSKIEDKTSFPDGYRFTFTFPGDVTINSKNLKGNTPYDYKIKKQANNSNTLSLEKAWESDDAFTKKVGLDCKGSSGTECCTMTSGGKLNVKQDTDKKHDITGFSGGKIKVEKDQVGYNQGLKFTIDGGDVTLTGGTKSGTSSDITKLEEYETYEIKEEGGKYYLSRKHESIVFLKKALGFEFCSKENFGQIFTCDITDVANLKNIKFHNMGSFSNWPSEPIKIQLSIERETSPGAGLKFTFNDDSSNSDDENIKNSTGPLCIPDGAGGSVNLKTSEAGPEYKIKKGSGSDTTLCLEKKSGNSAGTCAK